MAEPLGELIARLMINSVPYTAFYACLNVSGTGRRSKELADRLLGEADVAVPAGTAFGEHGEGYLRLSCANAIENIERALTAISALVATVSV